MNKKEASGEERIKKSKNLISQNFLLLNCRIARPYQVSTVKFPLLDLLPQPTSVIIVTRLPLKGKTERTTLMLEAKDFVTGCLTIILCAVLIPLFFLVFKLTLFFAIFLALATGIILGIILVGRIVRLFITGK